MAGKYTEGLFRTLIPNLDFLKLLAIKIRALINSDSHPQVRGFHRLMYQYKQTDVTGNLAICRLKILLGGKFPYIILLRVDRKKLAT